MWIRTETIISMSQLNSRFNSVFEILKEYGSAVVMKNNMPVYIVYEPDIFSKEMLDDMASVSVRDACQNFSKVTLQIYNHALVAILKRNVPIAVIIDYSYAQHSKILNEIQYIKGECKNDSNAGDALDRR